MADLDENTFVHHRHEFSTLLGQFLTIQSPEGQSLNFGISGTSTSPRPEVSRFIGSRILEISPQSLLMAPKNHPPGAKQTLVLSYLQNSLTVHSFKELEKALPSVASINSMQVKEYLQALTDEGKIRVEKIGSGNWYWSFLGEEKKARDNVLEKLKDEKERIDAAITELRERVTDATERRDDDGDGREELVILHASLTEEVLLLKEELNGYKDGDPGEIVRKNKEIKRYKEKAILWTENLELLEGWLNKVVGGDKERIEGIKRTFYGEEYEEGEGLKEL